jgi:hypothetical protein
VVSRHVIEHVSNPAEFLQSIRASLNDVPHARLFLETPCVEWILRNKVAWDFFYEHCSLFTSESLSSLVTASGFTVQSVEHLFGGQYLWLEAVVGNETAIPVYDPGGIPLLAEEYSLYECAYKAGWDKRLEEYLGKGAVCLWGAGAKGVTFANLVDAGCNSICCVVDVNENKQGKYLPGTGHSIVAPDRLDSFGVRTTILMNPNYREEVERILLQTGQDIEIVS